MPPVADAKVMKPQHIEAACAGRRPKNKSASKQTNHAARGLDRVIDLWPLVATFQEQFGITCKKSSSTDREASHAWRQGLLQCFTLQGESRVARRSAFVAHGVKKSPCSHVVADEKSGPSGVEMALLLCDAPWKAERVRSPPAARTYQYARGARQQTW